MTTTQDVPDRIPSEFDTDSLRAAYVAGWQAGWGEGYDEGAMDAAIDAAEEEG